MLSPVFPDRYWPLVIPGWTLNYEMAFYLIFAMTLLTSGIWRLLSLGAALVSIVVLGSLFSWQGILGFYSDSIVLIFLFGSCIGIPLHLGPNQKKIASWFNIVTDGNYYLAICSTLPDRK
jgi:peptidoglycan/LPS O-acetylase OafA/YrhL